MNTSAMAAMRPAAPTTIAFRATTPYWLLRVGAALCFIGHGAFGFITKAAWLPYFGVVGIPERWAWGLMPWVGAVDVLVGMSVLFAPRGLPLAYMVVWGLWTVLLRPLAGESAFETLERAGNYGVPLALLVMAGLPRDWRGLLTPIAAPPRSRRPDSRLLRIVQVTTVLLVLGHGALGVIGTPTLLRHYGALGLDASLMPLVGWFEIGLAAAVALRPAVGLLLFVGAWKMATEAVFIVAGYPVWESVERAGSYAAPLALAALILRQRRERQLTGA